MVIATLPKAIVLIAKVPNERPRSNKQVHGRKDKRMVTRTLSFVKEMTGKNAVIPQGVLTLVIYITDINLNITNHKNC